MRLLYEIIGISILAILAVVIIIALIGLGSLFAFVFNALIDALTHAGHLSVWQGMICVSIALFFFYKNFHY